MRIYSDEDERTVRAGRLAKDWARSSLIDAAQYARIAPEFHVDLRRTNLFLRLTLFGFGMLIIGAAVGLVMLTADVKDSVGGGIICLIGAAVSAGAAELLVGSFRLYRFGIEEACAAAAVVLVAIGSALVAEPLPDDRQLLLAAVAGAVAAFVAYRRFGYLYAGIAAMVCAAVAPFTIGESAAVHRMTAAVILLTCAIVARMKYRRHGDDYPGDEYAALQAAGVLGLYGVLNLHLSWFRAGTVAQPFYWFTYAMIWIVPVLAFMSALRERQRSLLDASLVMALTTLATNKPYLGLVRREWDPVLLGLLLIAAALILRRWLAAGEGGMRRGITASRILRSEKDHVALIGTASGFRDAPASAYAGAPPPDPFAGGGGRAGGGGADGSF
jgi:uncharacterized membrane protein YgcG